MSRVVFHPNVTLQERAHYLAKRKLDSFKKDVIHFEEIEEKKRKAREFLFLYKDFELDLLARKVMTKKEKEIEEREKQHKVSCENGGLEYIQIPRVLMRTTREGIDYNAHWVYMKDLYWKNQENFKDTIIFFSKAFFQSNQLPETLSEENKREINMVRSKLGWTLFGLVDE